MNPLKLRPYLPSPTAKLFHGSNAFFRGILGPVGSGKSVACVMEIFSRALEMPPFEGVRRSRWAVIRATYPELLSTTMKTFSDWLPESICPITRSPPITAKMHVPLADGTTLDLEVLFMSADGPDSETKFRSLEITGFWINEASEIDREVLNILTSRLGRYPHNSEVKDYWTGGIADSNAMDDSHWWYDFAEVIKPPNYKFFRQPPAMIRAPRKEGDKDDEPPVYLLNDGSHGVPAAENLANLRSTYYTNQVAGKNEEWIKCFLMGEYVTISSGKPVFPEYRDSVHCSKQILKPYGGLPLFIGFDFGLTPAAVLFQYTPKGQLVLLDEVVTESMGIQRMIREILKPKLANEYKELKYLCTCDPAGTSRSQTDEISCMDIVQQEGFEVSPCDTNNFVARKESVVYFLTKTVDGKPAFWLSPKCEVLRKGLMGQYCFRKLKIAGNARYVEKPEKNIYSHICDALQYGARYLRESPTPDGKNEFTFGTKARPVVPAKQFAGYV